MKTLDDKINEHIQTVIKDSEKYNISLVCKGIYASKNTIKQMKKRGVTVEIFIDEKLIDNIIVLDFGCLKHKIPTLLL
jgi:hypothetical protein